MLERLFSAFAAVLLAAPALLASDGTLSVSPAVVMLRGTAGQSTTQTLAITNSSSQPLAFEMVAKDVIVRDGHRVFAPAGETNGSIAATAIFSRRIVTVPPGERVSVEVTVTIPPSASGRAIIAEFHGTTKVKSAGMQITASLGTLLTFVLSDHVTAEASPLEVKAPTRTSNLQVAQKLVNTGTEPFVAQGVLAIVNVAGALVAREPLKSHRLLPGEKNDLHADFGGELPAGHYRALVTYDVQNDKPLTSSGEFDVR